MPGIKTSLLIKPALAAIERRNKKRLDNLKKLETAHKRVAVYLDRWVQDNFKTEGKKVGGWAPFAHGGRRLKDGSIDGSAMLLQDTGRLRASYHPFANRKDAGIGSDLPYSKDHEEGISERHLPQRRMLPRANDVRSDVKEIFDNFVKESIEVEGERTK